MAAMPSPMGLPASLPGRPAKLVCRIVVEALRIMGQWPVVTEKVHFESSLLLRAEWCGKINLGIAAHLLILP